MITIHPLCRQLLHVNLNLDARESAEAGKYRFPFEVTLPSDIPSSFQCNGEGASYCKVEYKLSVQLKISGINRIFGKELPFGVLAAPLSAEPAPFLAKPISTRINSFCCFDAGLVIVGARVANTRLGVGETGVIDFACKNQSTRGITCAEITVQEYVEWRAGHRRNETKHGVASVAIRPTARWKELEKSDFKVQQSREKKSTDTFRNEQNALYAEIHKAIHDGDNRAMIKIKPFARQSFDGELMNVSHLLKIKVYTAGHCTENPTIKVLMQLGTPSSLAAQTASASGEAEISVAAATGAEPSAPPLPSAQPSAEWASAVVAQPVVVPQSAVVTGGGLTWQGEGEIDFGSAPLAVAEVEPTLTNLLGEVKTSVGALGTVRKRLDDDKWRSAVFDAMTPTQFAQVVKAVQIEFDQAAMAELLAPAMNGGNFTHEYIIAALRVVSDWIRTQLLSKLLPLCTDIKKNVNVIGMELTEWEMVCAQRDFDLALQ